MGFIWDMIQQGQISDQQSRADSLEDRVESLEAELQATREALVEIVRRLENRLGEDFDGDGRVG